MGKEDTETIKPYFTWKQEDDKKENKKEGEKALCT